MHKGVVMASRSDSLLVYGFHELADDEGDALNALNLFLSPHQLTF